MSKNIFLFTLFLMVSASLAAQDETKTMVKDTICTTADQLPIYAGCETVESLEERSECSNLKLLQAFYKTLRYPETARVNRTEGMSLIKFVIEKDGTMSNFEILRDIGDGCGEAAIEAMKKLAVWNPALKDGKPVRIYYTFPARFKLE